MAKIFKALAVLVVLGFGLAVLTGCPDTVDRRPTVTVTALGDTNLIGGESLGFEATVGGWMPESVDNSIVWSIVEQGTHGGTFLDGNVLTVSTLERHSRLTVRASLEVDPSVFGQVAVNITPPDPIMTGLTLAAASNTGLRGGSVIFSAIVEGLHNPPAFMDWEIVTTGTSAGTTLAGGLLTIAVGETQPTITVRATSVFDPTFSAQDSVNIHDLPTGVRAVSAGSNYTVVVGTDGSLWAWGNNEFGQIGDGSSNNTRVSFSRIGTASDWLSVSAGSSHTLAIREDGSLWAWGNNADGRTGLGINTGTTNNPTRVGTDSWVAVSAGNSHTLAIRSDGSLWAWGSNANGRTGLGMDTGTANSPTRVGTYADWDYVSAGMEHSMGIRENGDGDRTLWAWGIGVNGRLGTGNSDSQNVPVQSGGATDWASVSTGNVHSMGVRTDGALFAVGNTASGVFGGGWASGVATNWMRVGTLNTWASVSAGFQHTMATRTDNTLWGAGNVADGRIGGSNAGFTGALNSFGQSFQAGATGLAGEFWVSVSAGVTHTVAIRTDGSLWAWGSNADGRTGFGTTGGQQNFPAQIIPLP